MSSNYWRQWDKDDLDSWQGKEEPLDEFEDDYEDEIEKQDDYVCPCGYYCFHCLGMSWDEFL